jgi:HlyD family secretion protein
MFWAPALAALVLVLFWLFRPQAVAVDLAVVERGPIQVTVSDEGQTRVKDVFVVSASVTGFMRRIELEAGDRVVANETIVARLEPSAPMFLDQRAEAEANAAVDAADAARSFAQAQLRRAEAEREFARSEYKRLSALASQQSISRNDLEAAERRAKTTVAAVAEARAALKMRESEYGKARARLLNPAQAKRAAQDCDCVLVRSPISGSVLRVLQESEGVVTAGTAIIEIGDPQSLEIKVELLSEDAVRVKPGQRALIEAWGGRKPLSGVVERVEPFGFTKVSALGIEEQRVNAIIDITSPYDEWQSLGHGYRVEPRIVIWESQDELRVPLSALFREGGQWAVFVDGDATAELRFVEVGRENGTHAQILKGLSAGERIVLHPNDRISDGARIEARRSESLRT